MRPTFEDMRWYVNVCVCVLSLGAGDLWHVLHIAFCVVGGQIWMTLNILLHCMDNGFEVLHSCTLV